MNLDTLKSLYEQDKRVTLITDKLRTGPVKLHLEGVVGSVASFLAYSAFKNCDYNHVFILEDKESAAYFQNDIVSLMGKKDIYFMPDSFKRPGLFTETSKQNILLRTESINQFMQASTRGEILVTYTEAVVEKIVSRKVLNKNSIHIKAGGRFEIDEMIDVLVSNGFERTDFVYEPGQFSLRGGILDIFSYGNDYPYRLELFDNEIESIRTFDPVSQLSKKKIARINIIPNAQTHFTADQRESFFSSLPSNTLVWLKNGTLAMEVILDIYTKAFEISQQIDEDDDEEGHSLISSNGELPFTAPDEIEEYLDTLNLIEFGGKPLFDYNESITFKTQPQPPFNKLFDLLIKDLASHKKKGLTNYLFAENPRQIERLYQIFEDLDASVEFFPVTGTLHAGFIDHDLKVACYTDHQVFDRFHKYHIKQTFSKSEALSQKTLRELQPGDFVTHIDHGIGKYSGLERLDLNGKIQEAVRLIYRDDDILYLGINSLHKITRYVGKDGKQPRLNKLGSDTWENLKRKTKKKVKDIARELIKLYAKRKAKPGYAFANDTYLQTELEASFIYEDTPDQLQVTQDVKADMESPHPMDRLVCGDVGFGKTEIAIRAAFKAVADSKQVVVLVPTTILALQHHRTFMSRLDEFPCNVDFLNRFKSAKEKKLTLKRLEEGKTDIVIGTHALLSQNIKFKDLGLLIIDEEQKFGVAAKEKLKKIMLNVDTLTLTATPIPRTLQFSMMKARDLSIINTPPPNRQPIQTELHSFNDDIVRDAIYYEVYRGGQVFIIHNRVKDIQDLSGMVKRLCPDVDIGIAHGQLEGSKLEKAMLDFINKEFDVLVCTNIIESGLDIPNANTIIINNAHWFGLSDLHQLRGRVGRSNKKAFCYMFTPPLSTLTTEARKRLTTIEQFADLGSGFNIALRDLDIRGAGNLLGAEQSGFISDIGFEMYHKILDEAILELKEDEYKDLFSGELQKEGFIKDCQVDTDLEILIPDNYVRNINERLNLYTQLNNIEDEKPLANFRVNLIDRFGAIPAATEELFNAIRLQWLAKKLGFERIVFKNEKMRCYFISNQNSSYYDTDLFQRILEYVQSFPNICRFKQTPKHLVLTFEEVKSMNEANSVLRKMKRFAEELTSSK